MSLAERILHRNRPRLAAVVAGGLLLSIAQVALGVDIQPTYDPNITAAQKAVIEKKISLWEGRLPHQNPEHVVKIDFRNADLGADYFGFRPGVELVLTDDSVLTDAGTTLAETDNFKNDADGRPTGARITINSNAGVKWYEGLEPPVPADSYDLYTVMNHELVHALGFTVNNPRFARNVTTTGGKRKYEGGSPTGEPKGTLTPAGEGTHLDPGDHPGDLMNPTIPKGTRRTPSTTDVDILLDDVWKYPTISGKLSNFDVWNRSGIIANDFMVTLGGILPSSITDIYNGAFNPFSPGQVSQVGNAARIKWGPGPGQVNPGDKAHFGFRIQGDITPLSFTFEWTQNNVVISTVPVNGTTWRGLTEQGSVRNRISNTTDNMLWVARRINFLEEPIVLDDLLENSWVAMTAFPIDPEPLPLPPGESITFDYMGVGELWGVVMIVDYFADEMDFPGPLLGTWYDADELIPASGLPGDMNCDGLVDFGDINPFVLAMTDPAGYQMAFPDCDIMNGDINGDGLFDFGDINPFVSLLAGP